MAISGFGIKAQTSGTFTAEIPWFQGAESGSFTAATDDGGIAVFTLDDATGLSVGDGIYVDGTPNYLNQTGIITAINGLNVTTNILFNGADTGTWIQLQVINFSSDTPEDYLRVIHTQFDTGVSVAIEITLNGKDYMAINNDDPIQGLATFTFFMQNESILNFRTASGSMSTSVQCVVTRG